jgi:aminoacylase
MVRSWAKEIGGITVQFERFAEELPPQIPTPADETYPRFKALKKVVESHGLKLQKVVCPGRTDACYLRQRGIGAYGFSPLNKTQRRLHDHNEYINKNVFLKGIDIMEDAIEALASI